MAVTLDDYDCYYTIHSYGHLFTQRLWALEPAGCHSWMGIANNIEGKERRRYPRVKAQLPLDVRASEDAHPLRTTTSEVSVGGCYVETIFTLAVGVKVFLTLWLNQRAIRMTAVVATRHPQIGNGFEFGDMPLGDRLKLAEFMDEPAPGSENTKNP